MNILIRLLLMVFLIGWTFLHERHFKQPYVSCKQIDMPQHEDIHEDYAKSPIGKAIHQYQKNLVSKEDTLLFDIQ